MAETEPQSNGGGSSEDARVVATRQRLERYLTAPGRTQRRVAAGIDRSQAAVSTFLKGTYQGNDVEVADRVTAFLDVEEQRVKQPAAPPWVETSIAKGVLSVLSQAEVGGDIGLVLGAPGMGKTLAVREHQRRSKSTILVTANPGTTAALPLLEEVVEQLRITRPGRTLRVQLRAVMEQLKGSGRVIVVDEAQLLNVKALECLRHIHDETGVGLVLAGNLDVHPLLTAQGAGQFGQFFSRIGLKHRVPSTVSRFDAELVSRAALPHISAEGLELLYAVANGWGGSIRHMVRVLVFAMRVAFGAEREVSVADLRGAGQLLDPRREVRS